ncbi:MAG: anhydro-N-acetylmuramic acid kinase [Anaerolineae bacterium]|nr:anhydro-N-acetylmuramic acid kinase [Anaerolineae bacterium]
MIVIGLMSGTSADGIDAAVIEIEDAPPALSVAVRSFTFTPYQAEQRASVFGLFDPETGRVDQICHMNFALGEWFAAAALRAIEEAGLSPDQVDLIGSHGQTIYHAVDAASPVRSTLQIGEPAVIAARTGVTTVADYRVADVAAGGQGAPLVSYVDWLLLRAPGAVRAVQNIGGIANVTYLPASETPDGVLAFDTGPGNMLIDDAARRITGGAQTYDRDGALAASGRVDERLLAALMAHPYLATSPPKTTGREQFGAAYAAQVWARAEAQGLTDRDVIATLTAFTAQSIGDAYRRFLPRMPDEVVLGGGGANNPTLVRMLRCALAPSRVTRHEALGMSSDAKEAVAFAVLAYEALHGRAGNLPACTGAGAYAVLGKIVPGRNYRDLVRRVVGAWQEQE